MSNSIYNPRTRSPVSIPNRYNFHWMVRRKIPPHIFWHMVASLRLTERP